MPERTQYDETVDEAIELLIDEDTDAFVLTARLGDELHSVKATNEVEDSLLAIWLMIEELRMMADEAGTKMTPDEVLTAAAHAADERGYLDGEFEGGVPGAR